MPKIGIIGGSGIYDPKRIETIDTVFPDTPYGKPSDEIIIGRLAGVEIAVLPRHGKSHQHPPSDVPYKANIYALKQLGVEYIICPCAVGSLKEELEPGDIVIVDQMFDMTKKRDYTYFHDSTVHVSMADPFCPYLNDIFEEAAKEIGIKYHKGGTYICIEGPRFSTRAESNVFRTFADVIGMTAVPECNLARELGMCYCSLSTITDYDAWKEEAVEIQMVLDVMAASFDKIIRLLEAALPKIKGEPTCGCLQAAIDAGAVKKQ